MHSKHFVEYNDVYCLLSSHVDVVSRNFLSLDNESFSGILPIIVSIMCHDILSSSIKYKKKVSFSSVAIRG